MPIGVWDIRYRQLTPTMRRLARQGRAFTRAYAVCDLTGPATKCLVGARWVHVADAPMLQEFLHRLGYTTGAFMPVSDVILGIGIDGTPPSRGFDVWSAPADIADADPYPPVVAAPEFICVIVKR